MYKKPYCTTRIKISIEYIYILYKNIYIKIQIGLYTEKKTYLYNIYKYYYVYNCLYREYLVIVICIIVRYIYIVYETIRKKIDNVKEFHFIFFFFCILYSYTLLIY